MSDIEVIRNLVTLWAMSYDRNQDEEWLNNCADDFTLHIGDDVVEGKQALRDLMEHVPEGNRGVHVLGQPMVEIRADTAHAMTSMIYVTIGEDGVLKIALAGRYDDDLTKNTAGEWKFKSRTSTHLHT